jgi:hypothetical protein
MIMHMMLGIFLKQLLVVYLTAGAEPRPATEKWWETVVTCKSPCVEGEIRGVGQNREDACG